MFYAPFFSIVLNWIPVSTYYIVTMSICAVLYCYLHEEEAESSMLRNSMQEARDLVSKRFCNAFH